MTTRNHCPNCGERFRDSTCLNQPGAKPKAGDWTVCAGCGQALVIEGAGDAFRLPTDTEIGRLSERETQMLAAAKRTAAMIRAMHAPTSMEAAQ